MMIVNGKEKAKVKENPMIKTLTAATIETAAKTATTETAAKTATMLIHIMMLY